MNPVTLALWPEGKRFAVTFSYDDGRLHDRRLVEILNRHGFRGTFNLNSGTIGREGYVTAEEIRSLYAGHEVAVHSVTHPFPTRIPRERLVHEIAEDRKRLEELSGQIVQGMSYPFGDWNRDVIDVLRMCGVRYSRTTRATEGFEWAPEDWLAWHPTCHDRGAKPELIEKFLNVPRWSSPQRLLYIWGHSYEFDREGGWDAIEAVCRSLRERGGDTLWCATNGMVHDYVTAARGLRFSASCDRVLNLSSLDVWILVGASPVKVSAGTTTAL